MRRVIRRRIRRKEDGLDLAIDFNADVAVNVGRSHTAPGATETEAPEADHDPDTAPDEANDERRDR